MVPIFTLDRKHIDFLIGRLDRDIRFFEKALKTGNPYIRQSHVDNTRSVRNKLAEALRIHKHKEVSGADL